jgi:hypothetical protein
MSPVKEVHLVEVTTDNLVRGAPKKRLWIVAAPSNQAIDLVLAAIPEGWSAHIADGYLTAEDVELLNLSPGDVRELTL